VSGLPFIAQDLDFHTQFANAPGCLAKLCLQPIVLGLLEGGTNTGQGTLAPFFEPVYRHRNFARNGVQRLAAQQAQDDLFVPICRPPFHFGGGLEALPVALRAPSTSPGTTSAIFDFFSMFNFVSRNMFYLKIVSRKIGGVHIFLKSYGFRPLQDLPATDLRFELRRYVPYVRSFENRGIGYDQLVFGGQ
jgi:hypothetical protein